MLLREETKCFAFCAGHESFAAAEGAIGLAKSANKARKVPLRVILNGLGKDAAHIIARVNGFTHVATAFDYKTGKVSVAKEKAYSKGDRAAVRCYGADDVREGVAIMHLEALMSPSRETPPIRPLPASGVGVYKKNAFWPKEILLCGLRRRHRQNAASGQQAAGPASYGMTDTMGRMHSYAQFAGSSSVPAHVEMMG